MSRLLRAGLVVAGLAAASAAHLVGFATSDPYGIFEHNDPARRLMVIANHNHDVAEYWEYSGSGLFPVDLSNEAYKLGVNCMMYGLTH